MVLVSFWITLTLLNVWDETTGLEDNIDRHGADYRDFGLPTDASPQACRQECLKEDRCRAFTYRRPAAKGQNSHCWLKNGVPEGKVSSQFISGVVRP